MSLALVLAIVGVAIGAVGLFFTIRQHRRTVRERNARARFDVIVRTVDADEKGIRWTAPNTTTQITRIAIGVKNTGEVEAGETLLNVLVPEHLEYARWAGPGGEEVPEGKRTAPTSERLPDEQGQETVPSKFLSATWSRIRLRPHYEKFVTFPVHLPPRESGLQQATVPVRVKVQADELPDDMEECVVDYTVRVVRRGPG
jgi:hypothetical protein